MTSFSVWAPDHELVELELYGSGTASGPPGAGERTAMTPGADGWWRLDVPGAAVGTRYRYAVDGGPARPDPRSPSQPEGIDGPSAVVDHGAFSWHDGAWRGARLPTAVIYELHVGTFSLAGTFTGAIDHLDHLVELGVTAVELLPVAEFSGSWGWGYDGVLLWAPHHTYGGPEGLKALVDACHVRGLAVVLDVVYNHLGPTGNHLAEFGPYFTDRYSTPWGSAVNVDGSGSDEVREFIMGNACNWLEEYHIDGLRLDAVHAIIDDSALHVLEELAGRVDALADQLGRPLWLIAESDRNDPKLVEAREAGGYGLSATWNDDFHHVLHAALTGERSGYYEDYGPLSLVGRCYQRVYAYGRDYSVFRKRHHGRPVGDLPATRFVACLQNHDQIGNRAVGERSAALMSAGRLRVGAALLLLSPQVPMLFQGEEWAASTPFQYFTDHQDLELGHAVSEGRRREFSAFGWLPEDVPDPQDAATRDRSVLDWAEVDKDEHAAVLGWHRELLALRRTYRELTDGRTDTVAVVVDDAAGWIALRRGRVVVAANIGTGTATMPLVFSGPAAFPVLAAGSGAPAADLRVLLASDSRVEVVGTQVSLPADTVAVVEVTPGR
jgi:maltooligosyltrehalose trehalohydrolase